MRSIETVQGQRVVTPEGVRPATVRIEAGRIAAVENYQSQLTGLGVIDAEDRVVSPGLVDSHVHINQPGRTEWEGFETATRAAAAGGVTTLVDMPLNAIPATTTVEALRIKRDAAQSNCWVDVGFWAGVVPGNLGEISALAETGVCGFKAFLVDSGVPEFEAIDLQELRVAAATIASIGLPLLVHSEHLDEILAPADDLALEDRRRYLRYMQSRPAIAEVQAIEALIAIAEATGVRLHIVHLATGKALPTINAARQRGVAITVESCPHYLTFAAEEIGDGQTLFKCAPPIREAGEREQLWQGLLNQEIDLIATDHSPSPPELKDMDGGDFFNAWGGISSLQLLLPAVWTEAKRRGADLSHLVQWLSTKPASLAGLSRRKGQFAVGFDADLVVWDDEASQVVDPAQLEHRHKITPYAGRELSGVVEATVLRGQLVYSEGQFLEEPHGALLTP